jgi:flavin-dependent dehydrogenase
LDTSTIALAGSSKLSVALDAVFWPVAAQTYEENGVSQVAVIGAGIAGLVAARVLADVYDEVTILERDSIPPHPGVRKGVAQGRHPHALLGRGHNVLEELFPGLIPELVSNGAVAGDISADSIWFDQGYYLASGPSDLRGILLSRPMLEHYVRQRVLALKGVRLLERSLVQGLVSNETSERVLGVRLTAPPHQATKQIITDLVVDASGRHSRSPAWLVAMGYTSQQSEIIRVDLGYMTRLFRRSPQQLSGKRGVLITAQAPNWRFGVALAIEDDRWIITLGDYFGDAPPANETSFLEFARTLATPDIADLLSAAEPLSPFVSFRFAASRGCRYERMGRFPANYLVFGDALCSFTPIYGQGITVAGLQGLALRNCLADGSKQLAQRFFSDASSAIDAPWRIAAGGDLRHPRLACRRTRVDRLLDWYVGKVHRAAAVDIGVAQAFLRVANLLGPPSLLFSPSMFVRIVRAHL